MGRILGGKFGGAKKVEKNVVSEVASAGDAYPGQDPPGGFLKAGFGTPSLPRGPVGGRIQCAAHKPPRERVVTHSAIVRQMEQARQVNLHMVRIFVSLARKVPIILQKLAGN